MIQYLGLLCSHNPLHLASCQLTKTAIMTFKSKILNGAILPQFTCNDVLLIEEDRQNTCSKENIKKKKIHLMAPLSTPSLTRPLKRPRQVRNIRSGSCVEHCYFSSQFTTSNIFLQESFRKTIDFKGICHLYLCVIRRTDWVISALKIYLMTMPLLNTRAQSIPPPTGY